MSYSARMRRWAVAALLAAACAGIPRTPAQRGTALRGAVVDDHGGSVIGATVRLFAGADAEPRTAETRQAGRFEFPDVPAGRVRVEASASGCFPGSTEVTVPAARSVECLVRIERTCVIEGTIRFEAEGVAGAVLEARSVRGGAVETGWSGTGGRFLVGGLHKGPHRVAVTLPPDARLGDGSYVVAPIDMAFDARAGGKACVVDLPAGASLAVSAPGGSVTIRGPRAAERRYPVEPGAPLRIRGLPEGAYELVHHAPDGRESTMKLELPESGTIDAAFPTAE